MRDRHAVQRPRSVGLRDEADPRARLCQRVIRIEKRPGLNFGIDFADMRQASFDQLLRADHAVADQSRRFGCGKKVKIG